VNDRFLFRGRADGVWYRGSLHVCKQTNHHHIIGDFAGDETHFLNLSPCELVEADPTTVGQCTGLKCKNGTLVFEGDILGYRDSLFRVAWDATGGRFLGFTDIGNPDGRICYITDELGKYAEIIGNIHDNPELLKGHYWDIRRECEREIELLTETPPIPEKRIDTADKYAIIADFLTSLNNELGIEKGWLNCENDPCVNDMLEAMERRLREWKKEPD